MIQDVFRIQAHYCDRRLTMRLINCLVLGGFVLCGSAFADQKIKMSELPAPVKKTVQDETKNAKLVGISKEAEGGKTLYELETMVNGKSRDLMIDTNGAVASIEEEVALDSIPAAAKDAIEKKVAGGKITKVETVKVGSQVSYEAAYTLKSGKKAEYGVNADGTPHK